MINKLLAKLESNIIKDRDKQHVEPEKPLMGFHGDQYLLNLNHFLLSECETYVETGARRGVTLKYVIDSYDDLRCFACEPDEDFYSVLEDKVGHLEDCNIYKQKSQSITPNVLERDELNQGLTFFFLDAHGNGFQWPLKQEINQISKHMDEAIILVDDFRVPDRPWFGFDEYNGQECSMGFIRNELSSSGSYQTVYPKYSTKTTNHDHFRGYCFILKNVRIEDLNVPEQLLENFEIVDGLK